jgi:hypothetical protein
VPRQKPTLLEIIAYIATHEAIAMAIAFGGLFLIGVVSMALVLRDHERNPVHPFEFALRHELLDSAWRQVGRLWRRGRWGAAIFRAFRAFWGEYRNAKAMTVLGRLDWLFISGGTKVALTCVSVDLLALIVRVWDWVHRP